MSLPAPLVLAVAAVVLAMESGLLIGVVLPGASLVLGLGLLSRFGVVGFADAVLTVVTATLLGSQLAFLAARRGDPAGFGLLRRRAGPLLARAEVLVRHYPMRIAVGRLVGGVRTVMPVVAARAGVRYRSFAVADVLATIGWASLLVGLGHVAGAAYEEVRLAVSLVGLPIVLIVYLGLRVRRTSRRRSPVTRPVR